MPGPMDDNIVYVHCSGLAPTHRAWFVFASSLHLPGFRGADIWGSTANSLGWAWVSFASKEHADAAFVQLDGVSFKGFHNTLRAHRSYHGEDWTVCRCGDILQWNENYGSEKRSFKRKGFHSGYQFPADLKASAFLARSFGQQKIPRTRTYETLTTLPSKSRRSFDMDQIIVVFVRNIPPKISEKKLRRIMELLPGYVTAWRDLKNPENRYLAWIAFESEAFAENAVERINGMLLFGDWALQAIKNKFPWVWNRKYCLDDTGRDLFVSTNAKGLQFECYNWMAEDEEKDVKVGKSTAVPYPPLLVELASIPSSLKDEGYLSASLPKVSSSPPPRDAAASIIPRQNATESSIGDEGYFSPLIPPPMSFPAALISPTKPSTSDRHITPVITADLELEQQYNDMIVSEIDFKKDLRRFMIHGFYTRMVGCEVDILNHQNGVE